MQRNGQAVLLWQASHVVQRVLKCTYQLQAGMVLPGYLHCPQRYLLHTRCSVNFTEGKTMKGLLSPCAPPLLLALWCVDHLLPEELGM
jgi:hypothetical protein